MAITRDFRRQPVRIYLCGSIKKGASDRRDRTEYWQDIHEEKIKTWVSSDVSILNPAKFLISRKDYFVNFGCDMYLVRTSDLVIADLRSEKGIGVGAEMMFAQGSGIPVISWLPPGSHYRRDLSDVFGEDLKNWTHPFAYSLSDYVEDSLEGVCHRINVLISQNFYKEPRQDVVDGAIGKFLALYPDLTHGR